MSYFLVKASVVHFPGASPSPEFLMADSPVQGEMGRGSVIPTAVYRGWNDNAESLAFFGSQLRAWNLRPVQLSFS